MNLFVLVVLSLLAICIAKVFMLFKRKIELASNLQGPSSYCCNIGLLFEPAEKQLHWVYQLSKNFDRYFQMWLGTEFWVGIYDPKLAEEILTNPKSVKSHDYGYLQPWLGSGLLVSDGQKWFNKRKAITPAFHFNILENFLEVFARHADVFTTNLPTTHEDNVVPFARKCTFDIICETSMGLEMDTQSESKVPYMNAVENITTIVYKRMFNPLYGNDFFFKFTREHRLFEESMKVVSDTTQRVISSRRKYYEEHPEELLENTNEVGVRKRMPLIDTLLRTNVDGEPLSNQDIEDEVNTFLFAGHDTTSHTLSFFLYNVGRYPEVQEKIYEEIISVFGGVPDNSELSTRKLSELKYLEAVIKESMRMYATTPFIGRQILEETTIGDLHLPADTNLSIFMFGMFRSEKIFKNADTFDPDRFKAESGNSKEMNPFAFIPFSAGPRNCIGQKFALLEMKTIILKTITTFNITLAEPDKELELVSGMILKTKDGINLKFKKRDV